jgi:hypothetical protein
MSTERKPGSRGVMDPFSGDRATPAPRVGSEPETPQESTHKGTTKTVSPRRSFKRKPRK